MPSPFGKPVKTFNLPAFFFKQTLTQDEIEQARIDLNRGAVVMMWRDGTASGGLALRHLGDPPKEIRDADGVLLVKRL